MSQAQYTWSSFDQAMHLHKLCKLFDMRIYLISIWMGLPFRWLTCAGLINAQLIRLQSVDGPDAANIHHWMQTPRQRSHSLIVNYSASYSNALLISKFSLSFLDAPVTLDFNLALAQWLTFFQIFSKSSNTSDTTNTSDTRDTRNTCNMRNAFSFYTSDARNSNDANNTSYTSNTM